MIHNTNIQRKTGMIAVLIVAAALLPSTCRALSLPDWAFTEAGASEHGPVAGIGMGWHLPWKGWTPFGKFTTRLESHVGYWSVKSGESGRWGGYQLVLVPLVRHTWQTSRMPVFVEGGIGVSYLGSTPSAKSGDAMRWNFHDTVAVGVQLGALKQYELSLRLVHQSNAGLCEPNPNMNNVQVRLSVAF